ncbi:hypothetical protein DVA86_34520 [Streptomyces armeniacus]|uniref:Uncharacterized protein n=1 Tax=Streptomyces armeniacus TaxID=83291 RepID=A0A345Y1W9_9ACTN|nr:hypothetical protein [Streptomyces armeniacus]AXK37885.1 hypothetical protein DVA86_34520 [Streptomyces armeniacus]
MTTQRQTTVGKTREAEEAREVLRAALRRAGIQLPSMDVRPATRTDGAGYALVSLGDCAPVVARDLAAAIERGAAR